MTTDRELLEMALEALEPDVYRAQWAVEEDVRLVIKNLRARLARPEQEATGKQSLQVEPMEKSDD
jgi:hypothetical protein